MDEGSAFQRSLDALSLFLVGDSTIQDTLLRVAAISVDAVERVKFAGITLNIEGQNRTGVFTDVASPQIDQAQYEVDHGPCLHAFRTGEIVQVPSTANDTRWREYAAAAFAHGIRATLSMPLRVADEHLGALNLYSTDEGELSSTDVATAQRFAAQTAVVLANASAYWDARTLSQQLDQAMASRDVIEQAKGIIMGSLGCSAEQAFEHLKQQSQHTNTKLRDIADQLVNNTARALHGSRK
jgi:GAF domain-containing protein